GSGKAASSVWPSRFHNVWPRRTPWASTIAWSAFCTWVRIRTHCGAGVKIGDLGTRWTASRSPETDPPPAAEAAAPHRGDRVSAGASPPSESPWDDRRGTNGQLLH